MGVLVAVVVVMISRIEIGIQKHVDQVLFVCLTLYIYKGTCKVSAFPALAATCVTRNNDPMNGPPCSKEGITLFFPHMSITQVCSVLPTYTHLSICQAFSPSPLPTFHLPHFPKEKRKKMAKAFLNRYLKIENSIKPDVGQNCFIVSLSVFPTCLSSLCVTSEHNRQLITLVATTCISTTSQ